MQTNVPDDTCIAVCCGCVDLVTLCPTRKLRAQDFVKNFDGSVSHYKPLGLEPGCCPSVVLDLSHCTDLHFTLQTYAKKQKRNVIIHIGGLTSM